jgi:hypothetical protein
MVRIDTLRRSLFALLPLAALATAACNGGAGTDAQGSNGDPAAQPSTDPAGQAPQAGESAATVSGLNSDGADVPANGIASGKEGDDPDFEKFAGKIAPDNTPDEPGNPNGVGSTSSALGTARGISLINEARREYNTLNKSTSYYSHTTYVNEATGTRRVDCSGFVDYILTRVMPDAYAKVPHSGARPLASDWYNYIVGRYTSASTQSSVRWRKITRVADLKPGDLVMWLQPPTSTSNNTGHIMVVNNVPRAGRAAKSEMLVDVIDSTSTPHANDSRGTTHTGIGTATIGLKVDANGVPTNYYWSGGVSTTAVSTAITLGRVE